MKTILFKFNKGFTILEMLLVIAILTVLLSLIVFTVRPTLLLKDTKNQKSETEASLIKAAIDSYKAFNGKLPDSFSTLNSGMYELCEYGAEVCPEGSIKLDELVDQKLILNLPVADDSIQNLTGYKVYYDADTASVSVSSELISELIPSPGSSLTPTPPSVSSNIDINFQSASVISPDTESDFALQAVVPSGTATGNVSITSLTGPSNNLAYTVENGTVPSVSGEGTTWSSSFQGTISSNTVWSQNILITGDVTVNSGVTLTINPGVTVFFAANSDALASGLWITDSEILVYGTLIAEGTVAQPIYFTSNAATKASEDWGGIVFKRGSLTSSIKRAVIHYATYAFRIHHWDEAPSISIKASITDSRIENNKSGVYLGDGHPQTWYSTLDNLNMNVRNNLIQNNSEYGVTVCPITGYGSIAVTDTDILGNTIINNNTGMTVCSASWWLGHNDIYPNIKFNIIKDSTTIGIDMSAHGASDGSGSDTDVKPIIQNNYLENNPIHIKLNIYPYYSDGSEILNPNIQNNVFNGGEKVFEILQAASYGTINPVIQNNLFINQTGFVFNNTTPRTITANNNFWGNNPTEWDAGPQAGDISGTVVATLFKDSTSTPMISTISNTKLQVGDSVSIYGAITGRASGGSAPTSTPTPTPTPTPPVSSGVWERCLGNYTTCNDYCISQGKTCSNTCTGFGGCTGTTNGYNQAEAWAMNGSTCWNQGSCSTTIESPDPAYNQSFPYLCHEWFNAACCCGI